MAQNANQQQKKALRQSFPVAAPGRTTARSSSNVSLRGSIAAQRERASRIVWFLLLPSAVISYALFCFTGNWHFLLGPGFVAMLVLQIVCSVFPTKHRVFPLLIPFVFAGLLPLLTSLLPSLQQAFVFLQQHWKP